LLTVATCRKPLAALRLCSIAKLFTPRLASTQFSLMAVLDMAVAFKEVGDI